MKTKRALTLLVVLLLTAAGCLSVQAQTLKMQFDFSKVSGTKVTDNVTGVNATLLNSAKVMEMGKYHVLSLGNDNGYLDMTSASGKVFANTDDYTVSVYYRVDESASLSGAGYFLWAFSTHAACLQTEGVYSAYRLNVQRLASSIGGYSQETGYEVGKESDKGRWIHVAYTQSGATGKLYIDGKLKGTIANMPLNSALYAASTPSCCWIGRAPFSADNYLKGTLVSDFCVYGEALTAEQVSEKAAETTKMDEAYVNGTPGDETALKNAIAEARQLVAGGGEYLPGALTELDAYVTSVEQYTGKGYSQFILDEQCNKLNTVLAVTKSTAGVVLPDINNIYKVYDINRGFVHPGGLHTQEDFDRVKSLLAAGNQKVTEAYNVLKNAEYAQAGIATWPVETIVRGGGSGQNYINAARGATMAYQNALRWKIEGNKACAKTAVDVLMAWARVTKYIGGDSNWALAAGLYGYEFAQAAEIMRDYEGWSREDFNEFKQWMLNLWYPRCLQFLAGRNGTWENWVGNQGGIRPGHYWSNWGLCNAFAVITIGILCDDVYIYNQGMSYMKYDQVGTFQKTRPTDLILNDGLTEFLGNLVVTTSESPLETGAYGKLGQMQESGRDGGHAAMALGLAVDIAHMAYNQGDDMFAYMDHRLAAGTEFIAASTLNTQNLPWTNYKYVDCRTAWHNGWLMGGPAMPAETRNYWGTVIGIYEGVKGVKMPFSERAYSNMGIDGGGYGSTSGGYDHLGYSVLMNTREQQLAPADKVPTELSPRIEYSGGLTTELVPSLDLEMQMGNVSGHMMLHNELGGIVSNYITPNGKGLPQGETVKLMPLLPNGEEDTGLWKWNTGETTRDITVKTDHSFVYRVTYTNKNGVDSYQCFPIAVAGDCNPVALTPVITYNGQTYDNVTDINVVYGQTVTLTANPSNGGGTFLWNTGSTSQTVTTAPLYSSRDYTVFYTSGASAVSAVSFHVNVVEAEPYIKTSEGQIAGTETLVDEGADITLGVKVPDMVSEESVKWNTGATGKELAIKGITTSGTYTATFEAAGKVITVSFNVIVKQTTAVAIPEGNYLMQNIADGRLLTCNGKNELVTFEEGSTVTPAGTQVWTITTKNGRCMLTNAVDGFVIGTNAKASTLKVSSFYFDKAVGLNLYSMHSGTSESNFRYWKVAEDGNVDYSGKKFDGFNFALIPFDKDPTGINELEKAGDESAQDVYDIAGRKISAAAANGGVYIVGGKKVVK